MLQKCYHHSFFFSFLRFSMCHYTVNYCDKLRFCIYSISIEAILVLTSRKYAMMRLSYCIINIVLYLNNVLDPGRSKLKVKVKDITVLRFCAAKLVLLKYPFHHLPHITCVFS